MEIHGSEQRSATVIGAGVVGIASAYMLARRGVSVTMVDAAQGPGRGTAFANGAQLSYNYADALASPAIWSALPELLLHKDGAFKMHPQVDWRFCDWIIRFLANCTNQKFQRNTVAVLKLAAESKAALAALLDRHEINFDHNNAGKMHLHFSAQGFKKASALIDLKKQFGGPQNALNTEQALALEPALRDIADQLVGAIHSPHDAVGDAHLFCREMAAILEREYGVRQYYGTTVTSLKLDQPSARTMLENGEELQSDIAVLCTGDAAQKLLKPQGLSLPIQPMKGYSFTIPTGNGSPKISITDSKRRIVFSNLGDKMRIAGLADLGDRSTAIEQSRLQTLIESAQQSLPNAGDYDLAGDFWTGLRPMTPNSQPIITRVRDNLAMNVGHGMLGWTLAMGSAGRLADLIAPEGKC